MRNVSFCVEMAVLMEVEMKYSCIYVEAHMATKFCRDPMRSSSNTNTKEVLAGLCVVIQIKKRGLEHCVVITTSKLHHHLGTCLWDMEASVKENKNKTVVVEVGEEGTNSIEGSRRNTCHTHSSMLLGWKSYIRWHGVQHWHWHLLQLCQECWFPLVPHLWYCIYHSHNEMAHCHTELNPDRYILSIPSAVGMSSKA